MNSFFCFIHIEKTAGSTLHQILLESFPKYLSIHPGYLPASCRRKYLLETSQLRILNRLYQPSGVGGHKVRSYLGYETVSPVPMRYFTFLRDPIARYLSHYQYQVGQRGLRASFDEFLSFEDSCDLQCMRLCGYRSAEKALEELQKYAFVGLVEDFSLGLRLLSYHVFDNALRVSEMRRNKTAVSILPAFAEMTNSWRERILINNKEDIRLHETFKNNEYPKYLVDEAKLVEAGESQISKIHLPQKIGKGIRRYGLEPASFLLSKLC